jgi:hypothetical protein
VAPSTGNRASRSGTKAVFEYCCNKTSKGTGTKPEEAVDSRSSASVFSVADSLDNAISEMDPDKAGDSAEEKRRIKDNASLLTAVTGQSRQSRRTSEALALNPKRAQEAMKEFPPADNDEVEISFHKDISNRTDFVVFGNCALETSSVLPP